VCQRWRRLLVSPALLQQAEVSLTFRRNSLPRLRSLCGFLQRHAGQHLRALRLEIMHSLVEREDELMIAAGVSACAVSLEELVLGDISMPVSWVAGMARLRRLCLHREDDLSLAADLTPLTRLERLRLNSMVGDVRLESCVALPPSLTFLLLKPNYQPDRALPPQVRLLGVSDQLGGG
jgi:ribosomal protein L30/L7E